MTNKRKNVLYVGITRDVQGRVAQHKRKRAPSFTSQYNVNVLVYYEEYQYVYDAILRERRLKNWKREWKKPYQETKSKMGGYSQRLV